MMFHSEVAGYPCDERVMYLNNLYISSVIAHDLETRPVMALSVLAAQTDSETFVCMSALSKKPFALLLLRERKKERDRERRKERDRERKKERESEREKERERVRERKRE